MFENRDFFRFWKNTRHNNDGYSKASMTEHALYDLWRQREEKGEVYVHTIRDSFSWRQDSYQV